jgi:hypothetical protein
VFLLPSLSLRYFGEAVSTGGTPRDGGQISSAAMRRTGLLGLQEREVTRRSSFRSGDLVKGSEEIETRPTDCS